MPDLDLETGKPEPAAKDKPKAAPKARTGTTVRQKAEDGLETRLRQVFERIASTLENRGDSELADAIREDRNAMSGGIVSLTRNVKPLRVPLLTFLNLLEPMLAFHRVGRILFGRFIGWRVRRQEERAQQLAEWEAAQAAERGVPIA